MISTDQFTRTGRRVVDMRQPKPMADSFENAEANEPYPFQVDSKFDVVGYYRFRGGKIEIIDGDITHYEINIGTPVDYGSWIWGTVFEPYYICIELTCSDADPANWTAAVVEIAQSAWPHDATGKKYFILAKDDATAGSSVEPVITQLWRGGNLNITADLFGAAPADPVATAAAGDSKRCAREDHAHRAATLNLIRPATADSSLVPYADAESDSGWDLFIGTIAGTIKRWKTIVLSAYSSITLKVQAEGSASTIDMDIYGNVNIDAPADVSIAGNGVDIDAAGGHMTLTTSGSGNITITPNGHLVLVNLPTSNPGGTGRVWIDSGTLKIT